MNESPQVITGILFLTALLPGRQAFSQEIDLDSLLIREVTVANPTYMPVLGVSTGTMYFLGDVMNT